MELAGETEKLREETHRVEREDVLTGVPQTEVVIFKQEGVCPLSHMLEVTEVVLVKRTLEQTPEKGLLALNDILLPPVCVIVERLKVVESARVLVEEVASEGGATPPGGQYEDLPGVLRGNDVSYSV